MKCMDCGCEESEEKLWVSPGGAFYHHMWSGCVDALNRRIAELEKQLEQERLEHSQFTEAVEAFNPWRDDNER